MTSCIRILLFIQQSLFRHKTAPLEKFTGSIDSAIYIGIQNTRFRFKYQIKVQMSILW